MVERHLKARGIDDPLLLEAMGTVPREAFVPEHLQEFVYEDSALPIESGQTISQPYIVARMIELAEIKPGDKVLEVGAGSGYAAAVMSRMANKVFAIERHEELAKLAAARLKRLGYANVEIICRRRHQGLAEEAPFQAIIVSAGGPHVPEALKQQLAIGGRLIVPVGEFGFQTLIRVRRTGEDSFEEEDFGAVAFVPLIGEEGWAEPERERARKRNSMPSLPATPRGCLSRRSARSPSIIASASSWPTAAEPFGDLHELCDLVERFSDRSVVMLGEATHGTAEFYQARARITEMLVDRHGFNIVAVEADWPDASVYDAYVRGLPRPVVPQSVFTRFPTWMWRNGQVADFLDRLKEINATIADPDRKAGFYGLDIYSLGASIEAVLAYLDKVDPQAARSRVSVTAASSPGAPSRRATAAWRCRAATPSARSPSPMRSPISCASGSTISPRTARPFSMPSRMRASWPAPSNITAPSITAMRRRGICATSICSTRLTACSQSAGPTPRRWSGRTTPISAMRPSPKWARCAASTISGSWRASVSATDAALIGFGTDRGTVAAASDWDGRHGDQARAPCPRRFL